MPTIEKDGLQIDYTDQGKGELVVLLHSSVSGNRQWRALSEDLSGSYRIVAPNLLGYGSTTPWSSDRALTLGDQARIVSILSDTIKQPMHVVGHSFGGSVAMKAAINMPDKLLSLCLLEPNPFFLLDQCGSLEAYHEALSLRDYVKGHGAQHEWRKVAERFADYWLGDGAWAAMDVKRKDSFIRSLPPNYHEWDAVIGESTSITKWSKLDIPCLVVSDSETRLPIQEIVRLLQQRCPHWIYHSLFEAGHMAPLTHASLVNPVVKNFLDRQRHKTL